METGGEHIVCILTHPLLAMLLESQSRPSYRPSPDVAHVLWMYLNNTKSSQLKACTNLQQLLEKER